MNEKKTFQMGTTFWTNPKHPTIPSHLHIVISDPFKNEGEIAIVNVTTIRGEHDDSCILIPGDHPRIQHPSYVGYARGWIVNLNSLVMLMDAMQIHRSPRMDLAVVARVQKGAMKSPKTPPRIKGLLAEQGLT